MKKLELGIVPIKDIQFASKSEVKGDTLYVNKEDIIDLLKEDENIENIELFIAKPGDSIRIMPVKDVIEPRVKVSGNGAMFPGMVSKVDVVGEGRTNVLRGMAVVTTGKIVAFQEGIIDMTGEGAKYTPFSQLNNLIDISSSPEYAALCGYTDEELDYYFAPYIEKYYEDNNIVEQEEREAFRKSIKDYYDGYRFSIRNDVTMYNPVSIGKFFNGGCSFDNFWIETGAQSLIKLD